MKVINLLAATFATINLGAQIITYAEPPKINGKVVVLNDDFGMTKSGGMRNMSPAKFYGLPPDDIFVRVVGFCESRNRQFVDGRPLRNAFRPDVVGYLQINTSAHFWALIDSGLDVIGSEADNITFGLKLYHAQGLKPWEASRHCWEPRFYNLGYIT